MTQRMVKRPEEISSGFGGRKSTIVLLLLTSILAHGILFSSSCIKSLQATNFEELALKSRNESGAIHDVTVNYQQLRASSQQQQPEKQEQLPHWRLATDCSSYSFDCFSIAQQGKKYMAYPSNTWNKKKPKKENLPSKIETICILPWFRKTSIKPVSILQSIKTKAR
jgi:hypothetical protein